MTTLRAGTDFVVLGRVTGVFGVRGWVKVYSYTEPRTGILDYSPWYLRREGRWVACKLLDGRAQGKGVVGQLAGFDDRDQALGLVGSEIAIPREQLPALDEGEYYWADLIGLAVSTTEGVSLGRVEDLMETGANDVLVVQGERERLIPFIPDQVVTAIDLEAGQMTVDWDPDF